MIPLREQRIRLEDKKGQKKSPKKKSPKKKGNLKNAKSNKSIIGVSEFDIDDATSAFTGYTSEFDKKLDPKDRITVDYFPL